MGPPHTSCTDGNLVAGDGCDADGLTESGWHCPTPGEPCKPIVGDGQIVGSEKCDDGDKNLGDGCDATGQIETGWDCPVPNDDCEPTIGDGQIVGSEQCDDGDQEPGDGCDAAGQIENGWDCPVPNNDCEPIIGDGQIVGSEQCDDGDQDPGDGCDAAGQIENGWDCPVPNSDCVPIIGDGQIVGDEQCDDGDQNPGDGCDAAGQQEAGWDCPVPGSDCVPIGSDAVVCTNCTACIAVDTLGDDFDGGFVADAWDFRSAGGNGHGASGGTFWLDVSLGAWQEMHSARGFGFVGGTFSVQIVTVDADIDDDDTVTLNLTDGDGDRLQMRKLGANLEQVEDIDAGPVVLDSIPYNAGQHGWWRLSENSGTITWQASDNGTTWVDLHSTAVPSAFNLSWVEVGVGVAMTTGTGSKGIVIDMVNLAPAENGAGDLTSCPTAQLSETFDGPTLEKWNVSPFSSGTPYLEAGALVIDMDPDIAEGTGVETADPWSLDATGITWRILERSVDGSGSSCRVEAGQRSQMDRAAVQIVDGLVRTFLTGASSHNEDIPYDPVVHQWFRIIPVGTEVRIEASEDGSTWQLQSFLDPGPNLAHHDVSFYGISPGTSVPTGSCRFSGVNE